MKKLPLCLLLVSVVALSLGTLAYGKDSGLIKFVGAVKSVAEDGSWQVKGLKGKSGKWQVRTGSSVQMFSYAMVPFAKIESGETVHVLGRYIKEQPGSGGGTNPPQIIAIQALFSGPGFDPPKITPAQRKASLEWRKGKLRRRKDEFNYFLGPIKLQANKNTEVVRAEKIDRSAVKKGSIVLFNGIADEEKKKPKGFLANSVRVMDAKMYKTNVWTTLFPLR